MQNVRNAFLKEYMPADASGEVWRVASRFALVAAAGESAREVTGWPEGASLAAAAEMFKVWLIGRGTSGHRLGDASVTLTLDTYSHVLPSMQQAATDKLESILFEKKTRGKKVG